MVEIINRDVNFVSVSDDIGFPSLIKFFEKRELEIIKAYSQSNPKENLAKNGEIFVCETSEGFVVNIRQTHVVTAYVTRHPNYKSSLSTFVVQARPKGKKKTTEVASKKKSVRKPARKS
ncbi:MAG TPA: hypothetical protein VLE47_00365 [Candidatus Saccharimonadales bacterium]|nr:hypothetical protein [Candidatus Saccharimonadales bacterium]